MKFNSIFREKGTPVTNASIEMLIEQNLDEITNAVISIKEKVVAEFSDAANWTERQLCEAILNDVLDDTATIESQLDILINAIKNW